MHERLSFYINRSSPIHSLNPLTKLILAFATIVISYISPWYWTPMLLIGINLIISYIGHIQIEYIKIITRMLLPVVGFIFIMQSFFLPGGGVDIFNFWFLHLRIENIQTAFLNASRVFVMVSSFILLILTTHPSELMTDLTRRRLPGQIAYVVVSTLQILPQMEAKANTIIDAQRSRGLDTQGSFRKRIGALLPFVGPLVFGSLVEVEERAIAIEARAFTSGLRKTSLRQIPDTRADKTLRWSLVFLVLLTLAARIWLS